MLAAIYPPKPVEPPSTFLLSPEALRTECNRLHASGWGVDEVTQVLDTSVLKASNMVVNR